MLRLLALVYLVAFLILALQMDPLLGSRGLLAGRGVPGEARHAAGGRGVLAAADAPLAGSSDGAMHVLCWAGVVLSAAALLGATNALVQLALWAIYMSFVHAGQIFYGYGWEIQLLETGLLAAFLCPVRSLRPLPDTRGPSSSSGCCGGSSSASCWARRSSSCATTRAGGT